MQPDQPPKERRIHFFVVDERFAIAGAVGAILVLASVVNMRKKILQKL